MRGPSSNSPNASPTWIAATLDARHRALEASSGETRALNAIRLARALSFQGGDAEALRLLTGERSRAFKRTTKSSISSNIGSFSSQPVTPNATEIAWLELGLAEIALYADDDDRAAVHLSQISPLTPRIEGLSADNQPKLHPARLLLAAWLAARRGAHHPLPERITSDENDTFLVELADGLALELLWTLGDTGGLPISGTDLRTKTLLLAADATARNDSRALDDSLRAFERAGLTRDLGRTILRVLATRPTVIAELGTPLNTWVGHAMTALGEAATFRDRIALRHAFRVHGRREADKALPREVAAKLDARDRMRAHVQSTLAIGLDQQLRSVDHLECASTTTERTDATGMLRDSIDLLDASAAGALAEFGRLEGELAQVVADTFAERERARAIAGVLAGLEGCEDETSLLTTLVRVISEQIGAQTVVVAQRIPHVGLSAIARFGAVEDTMWLKAVEESLDKPVLAPKKVDRDRRQGGSEPPPDVTSMILPMRMGGADGAVYVDKIRLPQPDGGKTTPTAPRISASQVVGTFSAADHGTLELLSSYGALALQRMRATSASASMGRRLAATIDAMRDGLLALDRDGIVTALNEPGARILRIDSARLLGRRLESFVELIPLASVLTMHERPDGVIVRLPSTSVVVHARDLAGEGTVVTLIEYERAQKLAQKLVGPRTRYTLADLRGQDLALKNAIDLARRAAVVDASVLIVGESGTGKELVAQAIHSAGPRAKEPFVAINCAALPRDLLEAELFGYERGAFTGARSEGSVGKFELAGDGTILLDEIVDLPLDMQAKLLRVLQERQVTRLGSSVERPVRARVLATAQRDLSIDVERGRFRLDLLHRLRVLQIQLPPLRQRPGDISILARHYIRQFAERQNKVVRDVSPEVESALLSYAWPGNVRELQNVMEGEVSLLPADSPVLDRIPASIGRRSDPPSANFSLHDASFSVGPESGRLLSLAMGEGRETHEPAISLRDSSLSVGSVAGIIPLVEVERRAYLEAFEKCGRSVTRAARALGVSKVTFYGKLRGFGMHPSESTGEMPAMRSGGKMLIAASSGLSDVESLAVPDDEPQSR